jgi:excisionase family DNA binding protein
MPQTKRKPGKQPDNRPAIATATPIPAEPGEVLTLAEAAAYLRVPEADVVRMVTTQGLPGRKICEEWRFLKPALQEWLKTPLSVAGKEALLALAGKFKDDPFLEDIVREAYQKRGRPIPEDAE